MATETHDYSIIPCPVCDGSGVRVHGCRTYELGCGYAHDDSYETPCPECDGTGTVIAEVEPITMKDLGR